LWPDNLADDVTGKGAAMQGVAQGAEAVRSIVVAARELYEHQEISFTGDYGDNGFLEDYTCQIRGEPTSVVVTVTRNAAGKAQHRPEIPSLRRADSAAYIRHRPRSLPRA
jgi:hypothetical protein